MTTSEFQPFTDRLSRDIRNDLAKSCASVIKEKSLLPARSTADKYLKENPAPVYRNYIESRMHSYARALEIIRFGESDPLFHALALWDEKLFFEVHEILEHVWLHAEGEEKLFLQAMIRAAGVYIKLDAGYAASAAKISAKALSVLELERNRNRLARYTDPAKLIKALQNLSIAPQLIENR